jgi:tetratricopeptide (TPR) repeat protein
VVTRVKAVATAQPEAMPSLLVLVDTSASRALGFGAQLTRLGELVERLARRDGAFPLTVAAFDQSVQVIYEGPAERFAGDDLKRLRDRRALGASDASRALAWALDQGKKKPVARVVLMTDGVFTAGATDGVELLAAVARLREVGVQRLDAVAVGGIRDEAVLARLVSGKLPKVGTVLDGELDAEVLARRLTETTVAKVPLVAPGAKLVWPAQLEGVQAGDEAVVVLELADAKASASLSVGGVSVELGRALVSVERPLLQRAWARARIDALLEQERRGADGLQARQKLQAEIVALSERHRVLSPYTALLVLETDADYARFRIDRRALVDILTVQSGHLGVLHRASDGPAPAPPRPQPKAKASDSRTDERFDKRARAAAPATSEPPAEPMPAGAPARAPASVPPGAVADGPGSVEREAQLESRSPEPSQESDEVAKEEAAAPPPGEGGSLSSAPASASASASAPAPAPVSELAPAPAVAPRSEGGSSGAVGGMVRPSRVARRPVAAGSAVELPASKYPYEGPFKEVMVLLARGESEKGLARALGWREEAPGDVLALVALGEACEALKDVERAARAYGSIIDLFPARADLRRFAGGRLERLKTPAALELAADDFAKAVEQRADHPASHRMLAFSLLRAGKPARAFEAIEKGALARYPQDRFAGVAQILVEDAALIAAAWMKAEPQAAEAVKARLARLGGVPETAPSLRFVLTWETDANDVDFHIQDARGGHAYYGARELPSGGTLYADVTTGYGPECFTIRLPPEKRAYPYTLKAHYYSRGPMGYGMGKLELIEHDGKGGLRFEERPYVVMVDQAFVDLGVVKR